VAAVMVLDTILDTNFGLAQSWVTSPAVEQRPIGV
jgi:hypothetical protein